MRSWGVIISLFYALLVIFLIFPSVYSLFIENVSYREALVLYGSWLIWIWITGIVAGQALLLFVSVDTRWRRLKPRSHVMLSVAITALLLGFLTFTIIWSVLAVIYGDQIPIGESEINVLAWWGGLWLVWAIIFYLYSRNKSHIISVVTRWLLRGSVLELLIAIPCHIIVRQRDDCSAPAVTAFGISTGIAIMLLSFGPSVLFLYAERMKRYRQKAKNEYSQSKQNEQN